MLQGYARMWSGDRRGRLAGTLLLANISLIVVAAVWRHAAADDPAPAPATDQAQIDQAQSDQAQSDQAQSDQTQAEQAQTEQVQSDTPPELLPSLDPTQTDTPSAPADVEVADDPVMEELRKVIRDPQGGLDIPRLDETSPLTSPMDSSPRPDASESESSVQLEQRLETIHALSTAAVALVRESRRLSDAGQGAQAAALRRNAADLRRMIASLAASPAGEADVLPR